ncbi:MAG TPA: response regulator [Nitrospiraceae bacterium]|nr:response regulator [Nitrospiraceae bacterium]
MPKVLVIDDEESIRTLLAMRLRHRGYDVLLADNGQKGLELYRQERPDIILLDLIMPEPDGVNVLKQIRSVDLDQPVIMWTGDNTSRTQQQVRALGASEVIVKGSAALHSLEATIKRLLKTPTTLPIVAAVIE